MVSSKSVITKSSKNLGIFSQSNAINFFENPLDSPIFTKKKEKKNEIYSPGFGRSKSEILMCEKPKDIQENIKMKLNVLEMQLNSRLANAKNQIIQNVEDFNEAKISEEYEEINEDFSILLSWVKSEHINLRLKKKNGMRDLDRLENEIYQNERNIIAMNKKLKQKRKFVKDLIMNLKKKEKIQILEKLVTEMDLRSEKNEMKVIFLKKTIGKLEGFKNGQIMNQPRKFG